MKIILMFLCLATISGAQETAHTARILFLNGPQDAGGPYYLFDGVQAQEVELPRMSFSPVYKLRPGNLKLWLLSAPPGDDGKVPEGAPSVLVPAGVRDFYLICGVDSSNKVLPIKMRFVNADSEKIGRGEMLWFNLTAKALVGKVGSRELRLGAEAAFLVKEPARGYESYPIELYFRVEGDERTHPLIESQWRHDPRTRSVVFVFDEGKRRAPRVMAFSDFRMPDEKEAP
jgi:hypothetical protein